MEDTLQLTYQRIGKDKVDLSARHKGALLHSHVFDPRNANRRQEFVKAVKTKAPGVDVAQVEQELLYIADQVARKAEDKAENQDSKYVIDTGHICIRRFVEGGDEVREPLCNFAAHIVEEVVHDDGVEIRTFLVVEGTLDNGTPLTRVVVAADQFAAMNWPLCEWGSRAIVSAGLGKRDHLRAALQYLSTNPTRQTIFAHTGWRKIGGQYYFLHAGGGVGPTGTDGTVPGVEVDLQGGAGKFRLPDRSPSGQELEEAVRASLGLLQLAPGRVSSAVLGAVYRAVLGGCNFGVHIHGNTGTFKTELATLAQQHFGADFDATSLPGNWTSTTNAIEELAFLTKDAILTVDDFAPGGSLTDVDKLHRDAARLFRNAGNGAARQRMRSNGTLRPPRPPRGLILSTGEDVPKGHSIRARLVLVEITRNDIEKTLLDKCQQHGSDGLYAAALRAYIEWLAPRIEAVQHGLHEEVSQLRDVLHEGDRHRRTSSNTAQLLIGWKYFLQFAAEAGCIDSSERDDVLRHVTAALKELAAKQEEHHKDADPTALFPRLLEACLTSGRAYVAGPDGGPPDNPRSWGWSALPGEAPEWRPNGAGIGWLDGEDLYLNPESAHAAAQTLAKASGESLPVTTMTLGKRLKDKGLLLTTDETRKRNTVRRVLQGKRREVWHVGADSFLSCEEPSQPSQPPCNLNASE
jgi:hypothetical protein